MIFVTVGAQQPFDRLVHALDRWAQRHGRDDVFAQIGRSQQPPEHIAWSRMLDPIEYRQRFWQADLIVSHAGAGTILTAMEMSKPLLVLPRRAELGETRSNHQLATARAFSANSSLCVADDVAALETILAQHESIQPLSRIGAYASPRLLESVRDLLQIGAIRTTELRYVPGPEPAGTGQEQIQPPRRKAA